MDSVHGSIRSHVMILLCLAALAVGCGSSPTPDLGLRAASAADSVWAPSDGREMPTEYRLNMDDEISIRVVGHPEFEDVVKVRPDGKISAPGVGDIEAAGHTVSEVSESLRAELRRVLRYPDVSLILTDHAEQLVYVMGEVFGAGAQTYMPDMTALHAIGAAAGPRTSGKMSGVLVLRRTGPSELEVYRVNLAAATSGNVTARDIYLQPYDIVYVPRTFIANVNVFVDHFFKQNLAAFTFYIAGWRAFHMDETSTVVVP